jgi:hypothetical protein
VSASRYRKKPVVIEALLWSGSNAPDVADFLGSSPTFGSDGRGAHWVEISTLEGTMRADKGDYIIKGIQGEFYPCKPDIFEATYDAA